ncbi:tetratricopeptide repeat protein [Labrenzia sp. VG12]|uniref:tetratricopeptide repeat protein n=1 Tax=Labrenzia sp. VG12 TaxID=2021862 RepID=UPI0012FD2A2F|nr:tetratricopeptide repeat protein [Labrenzia sp. VG12]
MNEKELEERLKGLLQKGAIEECRELIDANSNIDTKRISKIHLEVLDNLFLFKEGIERCLAYVEKYPRDAIFPLMASKFHFSQSEVTESQLWLTKAISNSYPKYNWSELEISIEMLAQHGRYREMIERLETADEKRKSTAKWAMLKARALAGIGDVEKARSWYQVADGISGQTSPEIFYLISHPKSGYTWLRYIIAQILAVKGGSHCRKKRSVSRSWVKASRLQSWSKPVMTARACVLKMESNMIGITWIFTANASDTQMVA